jgi:flagellin FlaB
MKKEAAFTGLEAAIVLIAFVVVAAVFSYVMLGAGFFATQKSQEVTYSGVKQATSNVVLDGQLYGTYETATGLDDLSFYIRVPEGGESVKLEDIDYLYSKGDGDPTSYTDLTGSLHAGQTTHVTLVNLAGPKAGCRFTLEIKPSVGASTLVQRTLASGFAGGVII